MLHLFKSFAFSKIKTIFIFLSILKKGPSPVGVVLEGHKDNSADATRIHTAAAMEQ